MQDRSWPLGLPSGLIPQQQQWGRGDGLKRHDTHGKVMTSDRHNFTSVQDIDTNFACIVGFPGSATSNMLPKISRKPRELPWQPNLGKKTKLNKTSCLQARLYRGGAQGGFSLPPSGNACPPRRGILVFFVGDSHWPYDNVS